MDAGMNGAAGGTLVTDVALTLGCRRLVYRNNVFIHTHSKNKIIFLNIFHSLGVNIRLAL